MSQSAGELLAEHLNDTPEPLQSVIREQIENDWIEVQLDGLYREFGLSEDQQRGFWIQAYMILCGVTSLEDLKDELIAEAGLDYETSVRLQRRFERDVLDPITEEAESRGMVMEVPSDVSPQALPSQTGPLYHDGRIAVTPQMIKRGGGTYPVSQISSVTIPFKMPFEFFGGFLLNGGCAVVGLIVILSGLGALFSSTGSGVGMLIVGAIMALIGGFNVRNCFNRKWIVAVDLINQEDLRLQVDTEEQANELYNAVLSVIT